VSHVLVEKAGSYVIVRGRMAFQMGPTPDKAALAIVRLGGHREGNETAWECAQREVFEESHLRITPLVPSITFQCPKTTLDTEIMLEPLENYRPPEEQPCPLIVGRHDTIHSVTAMFLATSDDDPTPSMETKALMLLTRNDVLRLCSETITLEEYQSSGGQVLFRQQVNSELPLKPFGQLVMLSMILARYPNVIPLSMYP
jgi:ADP-ribose pyrophosphatase YjhB (NUDIX family)